jgi:hypothetical protein
MDTFGSGLYKNLKPTIAPSYLEVWYLRLTSEFIHFEGAIPFDPNINMKACGPLKSGEVAVPSLLESAHTRYRRGGVRENGVMTNGTVHQDKLVRWEDHRLSLELGYK